MAGDRLLYVGREFLRGMKVRTARRQQYGMKPEELGSEWEAHGRVDFSVVVAVGVGAD